MNTRRLRRMQVTPEMIVRMRRGTFRVIANELPEDVVIMGANYDNQQNLFEILLQSDQWDPVVKGGVIPVCDSPFVERVI